VICSEMNGQSFILYMKKNWFHRGSVDNANDSFSVQSGLNYEKEGFPDGA